MSQKSLVSLRKAPFEALPSDYIGPELKTLGCQTMAYNPLPHHLMSQLRKRTESSPGPSTSQALPVRKSCSPAYSFLFLSSFSSFLSEPGQSCSGAVHLLGTPIPLLKDSSLSSPQALRTRQLLQARLPSRHLLGGLATAQDPTDLGILDRILSVCSNRDDCQ